MLFEEGPRLYILIIYIYIYIYIYILQKKIVRIIMFDHTEPYFTSLPKMNMYQINSYLCCILIFEHNKRVLPILFNDVFVLSTMTHKYSTKYKLAYKIPFCITNCRQFSLAYVGPQMWNTLNLNNSLHYSATLQIFKKE